MTSSLPQAAAQTSPTPGTPHPSVSCLISHLHLSPQPGQGSALGTSAAAAWAQQHPADVGLKAAVVPDSEHQELRVHVQEATTARMKPRPSRQPHPRPLSPNARHLTRLQSINGGPWMSHTHWAQPGSPTTCTSQDRGPICQAIRFFKQSQTPRSERSPGFSSAGDQPSYLYPKQIPPELTFSFHPIMRMARGRHGLPSGGQGLSPA